MSNVFIPTNAVRLDTDQSKQQIRLGIQGFPNTGKTWAALTFPNPIVLNLDRGLGAHQGREDVHEIPFYKQEVGGRRDEVKDKLIVWLDTVATKFTNEQTLIIDSCSAIEQAYHAWFRKNEANLALGENGSFNKFIQWSLKESFFGEIFSTLKVLKCDIIFITHEAEMRDKPSTPGQLGQYTGKIRPLMTGKVTDTMCKDFTDWFRMICASKPADFTKLDPIKIQHDWKLSIPEFKAMCDTFPNDTLYYWQTLGDDIFDAKVSSLVDFPKYLPANYSSFKQYMRKNK